MKKNEIIEQLVSKGCKIEEISGLKIKELRIMLDEENKGEDSLIMLDVLKQEVVAKEDDHICTPLVEYNSTTVDTREQNDKLNNTISHSELSDPPRPSDSGWTQHALSLFQDDELEGSLPRLEGLRRITELLIGDVIEERCELISSPNLENNERACSKCTLVFADGKIVEALADACSSNCQKEFSMYPVAMSDTRSKARAYRIALRLKRIVSAEEVGINTEEEKDVNRNAAVGQITAVRMLADRLHISIIKLLEDLEIPCPLKDNAPNLSAIKYSDMLVVLNRLNDLRQTDRIPEKLKR